MLRSRRGWNANVPLPRSPGGPRSSYLCVVLDCGHRLHVLTNARGQHLPSLAEAFGYQPHLVTAQATRPRVLDASVKGFWCKGVGLVSGDSPRYPASPAALTDGSFLAVVDCRPILQGWHLILAEQASCSSSELVDHFSAFLPEGCQLQIDGAPVDEDRIRLQPGTVLTIQFVPTTSDSDTGLVSAPCPSDSESSEGEYGPANGPDAGSDDEQIHHRPTAAGRSR